MEESGIDALFVSQQSNITYLTGFTGLSTNEREAFFIITKKSAFLLAYATYFGLIKKRNKLFQAVCLTPTFRLTDALNDIIKKENIKKMGIEKNSLTMYEYESLKSELPARLIPVLNLIEKERLIKSQNELEYVKKAATYTDKAFEFILKKIKKGVSERKLALEIEFYLKSNAQNIAFPPIVAFNKNAAIPHYLPSASVNLEKNSLILLDLGAKFADYCSDLSRVVFFGRPDSGKVKIFDTVNKAQALAINKIKPGIKANLVDAVARDYIKTKGFPEFQHGTGHGVGLDIHENPRINALTQNVLTENMVFTVEPGIYLEGNCGVRIEDLLVLRKDGPEVLSKASKELIII